MITFDEFKRVDLRAARVIRVEDIPGKDRLYKLFIDVGGERQIVAGIKEHYAPTELVGKTIIVVANLEPAVIAGVKSNGMLLAVTDRDGRVSVLTPDGGGDVAPGTKIS